MTARRTLAAIALAGCALGTATAGASAATTTVRVTEGDVGTEWFRADTRGLGAASLVTGPATPPLGTGSLRLDTANAGDKAQFLTSRHSGVRLEAIDAIGYSTYRQSPATGPVLPSINMRVDWDGDDVVDSYLVFEPYVDQGNDAVQTGVWQSWDAYRGGAARWWVSHPASLGGACGQPAPCSWSSIVAARPDARILEDPDAPVNSPSAPTPELRGSFGVNQGSGNAGTVAFADALTLGVAGDTTVYDLDVPPPPPTAASECRGGGWRVFENPAFRNQGECVSFVVSRRP